MDLANMSLQEIEKLVMNMKNSRDPLSHAKMLQLRMRNQVGSFMYHTSKGLASLLCTNFMHSEKSNTTHNPLFFFLLI